MKDTKKIVIAGGPCCGKSTLIKELKKRGYYVIEESAREVLAENIKIEYEEIQIKIFRKQLEKETEAEEKTGGLIFLDRGHIDGIAYCQLRLGFIPEPLRSFDFKNQYDFIFILDLLPFENDGLRVEKDNTEAKKIHEAIISTYKSFDYNLIIVPVMPIKERVDYILEKIK